MPEVRQRVGDPFNPTWLIEDPDSVDNETLSFFLDYWRKKRAGKPLPLRNSFIPQEVRGHLQWVSVADKVEATGNFRYRVVGSRPAEYFLGNGTGKTIREAFAGGEETFIAGVEWLYYRTCETRAPIRLLGPPSTYRKVYFPSHDSLYLPYSTDGEIVDRVVNIFWFNRSQMSHRAPVSAMSLESLA